MSYQNYQPPKIRQIITGIVISVVLIGMLWSFPDIMKRTGDVFLYIPSRFGLIQRVLPKEVHTIDLRNNSFASFKITKPGRYNIFTGDYLLLQTTIASREQQLLPWAGVTSSETNQQVIVSFVERGMRPYDTPFAAGRPIFTFEVDKAGDYEILYPAKLASISIVPDYTTGKEQVISIAYLLQVAVLLLLFGLFYYPRYQQHRVQRQSLKELQIQKRVQSDVFWKTEINRQSDKPKEEH